MKAHFTWTNPTTYNDGSPVNPSQIVTSIYDSQIQDSNVPIAEVRYGGTAWTTADLPYGVHNFSAQVVDLSGTKIGGRSNIATITITAMPSASITNLVAAVVP